VEPGQGLGEDHRQQPDQDDLLEGQQRPEARAAGPPRGLLRGGASDDDIVAAIEATWRARDDRYSDIRSSATPGLRKVEMSHIGG